MDNRRIEDLAPKDPTLHVVEFELGPGRRSIKCDSTHIFERKDCLTNWLSTYTGNPGLIIKELTPSLRDDFLHFFDTVAFADNPEWSDCYCSAYHFANKGKAESHSEASSLIEEDRMHGFLAYDGGEPVGWCNAAPRSSYPGVHWLMGPSPDKYERVGSIVCFVIASSHRGQGVASQLLNAACKKFSQKALEYAEAYPIKKPESAAYNFPGPLSMYLKNGFSTHCDADWYLVVRKRLEKPY